jgi:hypothetical protein
MTETPFPPILVLGRDTCEDTIQSRAHLEALGIPYVYGNVEIDPAADVRIRSLNDGAWVTPTILIGDPLRPAVVVREPSDDELDAAIARAAAAG